MTQVPHFRCIHLSRTVGDSNPVLIINEFVRVKGSCLRSAYGRKIAVRFLWQASTSALAFSLQSVALAQVFPRYTSSRLSSAYC